MEAPPGPEPMELDPRPAAGDAAAAVAPAGDEKVRGWPRSGAGVGSGAGDWRTVGFI
jgi:hypothetical protein